jgi:hypothetical protein
MNCRNRMMRAAAGCAVVLMIASTSAWANNDKCHKPYQLAGAWVGQSAGIGFAGVLVPLDPEGRTAVWNCEWVTLSPQFRAIQAQLGVGYVGTVVGEMKMTGRNTAALSFIWHNADTSGTKVLMILTLQGTLQFTRHDAAVADTVLSMYLTGPAAAALGVEDADKDGDLLPDEGAVPFKVIPFPGIPFKRVPALP